MAIVRLVWMNDNISLVEVVDNGPAPRYRRVIVPSEMVAGDTCSEETLCEGIAYGKEWERLVPELTLRGDVANELRRRGLWLRSDVLAHPDEARSAFIEVVVNGLFQNFLRAVKAED